MKFHIYIRNKLLDPGGKREQQLRDGILVMVFCGKFVISKFILKRTKYIIYYKGADPMSGIRPQYRTKGLSKQHLAPGSKKPLVFFFMFIFYLLLF